MILAPLTLWAWIIVPSLTLDTVWSGPARPALADFRSHAISVVAPGASGFAVYYSVTRVSVIANAHEPRVEIYTRRIGIAIMTIKSAFVHIGTFDVIPHL